MAFVVGVVIALAVFGIGAGSSLGAATTTKAEWYTGAKESSVSTLVGKQSLSISTGSEKVILEFVVASLPIPLTSSGVSCQECIITNESLARPGVAVATGRLVFTGVVFDEPHTCKVKEGKITTEPLTFEAHYMQGERWILRIEPPASGVAFYADFEKSEPEKPCPFEGHTPIKGVNYGEFKAGTGSFATEQQVLFSRVIGESAGGVWSLGPEPFWLTGALNLKVGGSYFGVK